MHLRESAGHFTVFIIEPCMELLSMPFNFRSLIFPDETCVYTRRSRKTSPPIFATSTTTVIMFFFFWSRAPLSRLSALAPSLSCLNAPKIQKRAHSTLSLACTVPAAPAEERHVRKAPRRSYCALKIAVTHSRPSTTARSLCSSCIAESTSVTVST